MDENVRNVTCRKVGPGSFGEAVDVGIHSEDAGKSGPSVLYVSHCVLAAFFLFELVLGMRRRKVRES